VESFKQVLICLARGERQTTPCVTPQ